MAVTVATIAACEFDFFFVEYINFLIEVKTYWIEEIVYLYVFAYYPNDYIPVKKKGNNNVKSVEERKSENVCYDLCHKMISFE